MVVTKFSRFDSSRWLASQVARNFWLSLKTPQPGSLAPRPDHVPPELAIDFDFNSPGKPGEDVPLAWKRLHAGPDIFWTPRNGGHWVATRAEDSEIIQRDTDHFSNAETNIPSKTKALRLLPVESDPPDLSKYRALLIPFLTPKVVAGLEDKVRALAIELIEGFRLRGECEFVTDFARLLPIVTFLRLVELPLEDRERLLNWTELAMRASKPGPRMKGYLGLSRYLCNLILERRAKPGNDLISKVATASIDGRPLTFDEVQGMVTLILFGGLDSVSGLLGYSTHFLAQSPAHRRQLVEHPELIPNAVEELLRRFSIVNNARIMARDFRYKGILLKKDEQIQLSSVLYGLDDRKYQNPLDVDFTRTRIMHSAFGSGGPHRCLGSYLARTEIRVFIEEWLKRIPEFSIKPGEQPRAISHIVNTFDYLPLVWNAR